MKQYNQIKVKYPDALLLFRVGDFYETFGEDAIRASSILGIVLTKRGSGSTSETELAGFPHHSINTYLPKLVKAGCRVAICDQLEDPKFAKKIVKRGVTELVTPGVSLNDEVLEQKKNNYLASICFQDDIAGVSFLDISTGDFWISEGEINQVQQLIENFSPKEILVPKPFKKKFLSEIVYNDSIFYLEDWAFEKNYAHQKLLDHFGTRGLKGFGISELLVGINSSGAILHYLSETNHNKLSHITNVRRVFEEDYVWMDRFTVKNLELFAPNNDEGTSLIDVLDHTSTPMGGRMLKHWIKFPLRDVTKIDKRLNIVESLIKEEGVFDTILSRLEKIADVERIAAKIVTLKIGPRALLQLGYSLIEIEKIKKTLLSSSEKSLKIYGKNFLKSEKIVRLILNTIKEDAPVSIIKGQTIASGVSKELDELRELLKHGKGNLDRMLERESKRTQIPSLKISFNNVFGYYIEVRNTHKDKVPEEWIRKQTLVNAERYITEELKEFEAKIFGAEEKIKSIENSIFQNLLDDLQKELKILKNNSQMIAKLDVLTSFSFSAIKDKYCRTKFIKGTVLEIKDGRHPVIESSLPPGENYIPNDLKLDNKNDQIIMITGPNMSGKSAILRQTALLVIMSQIGSFVPARAMKIGIIDKIFTRVGASDNISMGESTFMVEMNETASILNNITNKSLVLLDEIGRGTSTYDGISIAWAIAEYLHESSVCPKVLFATHYHELNEMTNTFERIKNYNVSVKEYKDKVLFLRKLVPGGSAHSFGIHVAKMAGMPKYVVNRASEKLKMLEKSSRIQNDKPSKKKSDKIQLSFFDLQDPVLEKVRDEIDSVNVDELKPVEALIKLNEIKRALKDSTNK
ncbi:MAG: DNA mismatch repair protein MutS [Bacteroidota bacterium]|nr:DNA mismatch repair protein MutS [Bacteroidota bacterium]